MGDLFPLSEFLRFKMSCNCIHQSADVNCGNYPHLCERSHLPILASGDMGVGQVNSDVQECATVAKQKLYADTNALQELYNQGYTDQQIWNALYAECEKQLGINNETKPLIPEKINTYGAIGIAAGTLAIGMLFGYFIGKP